MKRISEKTFYHYLKCPSWVYFDAHDAERVHDALLSRLIDDGLLPEVQRDILSDRQFAEVEHEDPDEAFKRTLELMRQGEQTILRGVLIHGHWIGHPDILERVEGKSEFGNYYYVACDLKRSRLLRDEYKFQGAFYAELLEKIQKIKPVQGYVMSPDGMVQAYLLEEFESKFHLTLEEIEKIMAGQKPPHFVTSGCKQSPWFSECRKESLVCDDLSLINRIWRSEVKALNEAGIQTVKQLAASDPDLLAKKVSGLTRDRLHWLRMQSISLVEKRVIVMSAVHFPESKIELYFDIESSPLRDVDYLFGVVEVKDGKETYHSFIAKSPSKQETAWWEFMEFLKKYPVAPIYHYGWYEIEVMKKHAAKYGNELEVERIISDRMHDLLMMLRDNIIFPLHFYSLKDIAHLLGFSWREGEVSGINAVIWYEQYQKSRRKKKLQQMLDYNEDDCKATYVVKKWANEKAGE